MKKAFFKRVTIRTASELLSFAKRLPLVESPQWWLFRGLGRSQRIRTSLERLLVDSGMPLAHAKLVEIQLLKAFKRHAHFYVQHVPHDGDLIGWLALMRHHGAPTRLLDWTYSFYIAAFFALSNAKSFPVRERKPCVVWALYREAFRLSDQAHLASEAYKTAAEGASCDDVERSDSDNVQDGINAFLRHVIEYPHRCVWAVNPFRLNERLSLQQGVFLCPGDVTSPFEANLAAGRPSPKSLVCFELSSEPKARAEMMTALYRMNVNEASLFPGLDGFARSLNHEVWVPSRLRPKTPSHG